MKFCHRPGTCSAQRSSTKRASILRTHRVRAWHRHTKLMSRMCCLLLQSVCVHRCGALPVGTVYRARVRQRGEKWQPTADQMGPPPKSKASAGRMNPAGIPYLYAAFDNTTAWREVGIMGRTSKTVFTATFALTKPLWVMDLTALPPVPSLFDVANKEVREQALIVRAFVEAISTPVTKDGQEHIDYVPSQVICEYLAQVFEPGEGRRLGGLYIPVRCRTAERISWCFPRIDIRGHFTG